MTNSESFKMDVLNHEKKMADESEMNFKREK